MIDSTPHTLLDDTQGSVSASPYGGGGRRAVMPVPASNPVIGQSPASPYAAGFTEPLVRRAAPARTAPSAPAPVEPAAHPSPVPPPPLASPEPDQDARLEEPSPTEPSPSELSPIEPETEEPSGPLELAEPTDQDRFQPEATPGVDEAEGDAVDDGSVEAHAIEADAVAEEPVDAVTEPSRVRTIPWIPWIPRVPESSLTGDMSAAQAYTTPLDPSMWFIGPLEETQAPPFVRVRRQGPERVDRGLLFASIPLILGCALSAAMFHTGHIPSIVALAMAPAGALLYGKGAGSRPHAGSVRLVALLVVGVLLVWPISLATELFLYYRETTGTSTGAIGYVVSSMFSVTLFMAKLKELLLVALFGLGGVIAVVQTMVSTRQRRRSGAS